MRLFGKADFSGLCWNENGQQIVAVGHNGAFVGSLYNSLFSFCTHSGIMSNKYLL